MEEKTTSITPGFDRGQTIESIFGLQKPYLEEIEKAEKKVIEADANLLRATEAQKTNLARERTSVQRTAAEQERIANEEYKRQKAAEPIPAFVPTRDSAEDLAKLFSFIGVAGTIVSRGAGKQAAMGAMSAMTGMMEGWQKGRMDLYNQEKTKFDKDFARVQKIHQDLAKELDTAVKTIATDRELGIRIAEEAALNAGSDVLLAKINRGEFIGARDMVVRTADAFKEVVKQSLVREDRFITAKAQVDAAQARAGVVKPTKPDVWVTKEGKFVDASKLPGGLPPEGARRPSTKAPETGEKETRLKPGALETKAYRSSLIFKDDLTSIAKSLMDPKLVQQIKDNRVQAFLSEEGGKAISQLMNENIPSELRTFLTTIRNFRNNYYLDISGKAVTGGEALRNYGVVMQPGDSPELMRDKIGGLVDRVERNIVLSEQIYAFPKITSKPGQKTDLKPGEQLPVLGAAKKQQMPAADKLKTYADTHFSGDVAKAKAYLAEQGYEE